jgi:Asp/Glu/hydantoin racemase
MRAVAMIVGVEPGGLLMLSLLHTVDTNKTLFADLLREMAPDADVRHAVRPDLLADAMQLGSDDPAVIDAVESVVREAAEGADAVLCTCSTIGGIAEATATEGGIPVLRVDRAMAREAVRTGPRIVVAAAVESTLTPTRALVEDEARRQGRDVELTVRVIDGAWDALQSGGREAYLDAIERWLRDAATEDTDVFVLAQATMAGAAERCQDLEVPVLSSPRLGLAYALEQAGAA